MPWSRHRLRDQDVWAKVDTSGALVTDRDGRVEIVYKPANGAKVYRAGARNLTPTGEAPLELVAGEPAPEKADKQKTAPRPTVAPPNAVHVWTDGGARPNPGPCGLGVVIVDGDTRKEISEFLGTGTNQIAELTAILRGLQAIEDKTRPTFVYSDSAYSIGLLSQAWKAKANVELVAALREVCRAFSDLRFVKVAAHTGIPLNERCDQLVGEAITRRR
ncbi:MAG: ribonuclease [Myxococcales bacterium]|nr:ribonuclease [Myxococcales bacterium]